MTEISDDELTGLSEFDLLAENAEQAGATGPLPAVERVEADTAGGRISALRWAARRREWCSSMAAARMRIPGTP
ncbi:hydrolase domain protein [Mycobacterium kansasii]|uniref:Hydrolase domain protein n=1 Tax=Mycobacterium kansasii TaxID=1768 RepID=A0A1V3XA06_MYCKA|nr:hydrolase domain protein [Mycobacterium kansasii]